MGKLLRIRFIIFFSLVLIVMGCASKPELTYEDRAAYQLTPAYIKSETELNNYRNDSNIYFGEGMAVIGTDIAAAREESKRNALEELSSQIKIVIESDIELIMTGGSTNTGGKVSDEVTQTINSRTATYTNQILSNVKGNKQYLDFPMPGYVTYFVYIDKAEYEEKVKHDLEIKQKSLKETILNGDKAMDNSSLTNALQQWLNAQSMQHSFFGNMPVEGDLNGDGITEEFSAAISERINRILGNLIITTNNETYTYDSSGRVNASPSVYLKYRDENLNEIPAALFPLKVSFTEGYGRLPRNLQTDTYGQLTLNIENVDSSKKVTRFVVEIDKKAFQGLESNSLPILPSVEIQLEKLRTVAVSFAFSNGGRISSPQDMKVSLSSLVLGNELAVLDTSVSKRTPTNSDFQKVTKTNADYLLLIYTAAGTAETAGGYSNMYNTNVSGIVSLYSLPFGEMIFSETIPVQKGFGSSADGAGWDGYGQMRQDILRLAGSAVEKLVR